MSSSGSSSYNEVQSEGSKKRPLQATESSSSTSTSQAGSSDQKHWCGVCHEPLHHDISPAAKLVPMAEEALQLQVTNNNTNMNTKPPPPVAVGTNDININSIDDAIVSCSNEGKACCRASTREGASPHFHFHCLNIPEGSKLDRDLRDYLKYEDEKKGNQRRQEQDAENNMHAKGKNSSSGGGDRGVIVNQNSNGNAHVNGNHNDSEICDQEEKGVPNPFLCPLCDVQGTSKYLYEYFVNFRTAKVAFYHGDGEAKDNLQPVGFVPIAATSKKSSSCSSATEAMEDYNGTASDNGFVKYLVSQQLSRAKEMEKSSPWRNTVKLKPTELTIENIKNIINSLPCGDGENSDGEGKTKMLELDKINATYLIGQPIRLFCSVTNSYHSGRIIDSRIIEEKDLGRLEKSSRRRILTMQRGTSGSPRQRSRALKNGRGSNSNQQNANQSRSSSRGKSKNEESNDVAVQWGKENTLTLDADADAVADVQLDKDIGRTQYLIRFRADIEGRKIPVQQWLFLEEHPIMVGVAIIWAKLDEQNDRPKIVQNGSNLSATVTVASPPSKKSKSSPSSPGRARHLKKARSKFRPAQIFVRTCLEMMHVDEINSSGCDGDGDGDRDGPTATTNMKMTTLNGSESRSKSLEAIGFLFGPLHRCIRIQLSNNNSHRDSDTDLINTCPIAIVRKERSASADKSGAGNGNSTTTTNTNAASLLDSSLNDLFAADFYNPPMKLIQYLQTIKTYDDSLVYASTFACMEEEEQRRVLEGSAC